MPAAGTGAIEYRVRGTLPDLPGRARAWTLGRDADGSRVETLARALGLDGPVKAATDGWTVTAGGRSLRVERQPGLPWNFGPDAADVVPCTVPAAQPGAAPALDTPVASGGCGSSGGVAVGSTGSTGSAGSSSGAVTKASHGDGDDGGHLPLAAVPARLGLPDDQVRWARAGPRARAPRGPADACAGRGHGACALGEGGRRPQRRTRARGGRILAMAGGRGPAGRWAPHPRFQQWRVRRPEGCDRGRERLVGAAGPGRRLSARHRVRGSRAAETVAVRYRPPAAHRRGAVLRWVRDPAAAGAHDHRCARRPRLRTAARRGQSRACPARARLPLRPRGGWPPTGPGGRGRAPAQGRP